MEDRVPQFVWSEQVEDHGWRSERQGKPKTAPLLLFLLRVHLHNVALLMAGVVSGKRVSDLLDSCRQRLPIYAWFDADGSGCARKVH